MKRAKLTKTALKKLKDELKRYHRYLPTLQIKKQLLQQEVSRVRAEIRRLSTAWHGAQAEMDPWLALLGEGAGLGECIEVGEIVTRADNIAGVDIPIFIELPLRVKPYDLVTTPLWLDRAVASLCQLLRLKAEILLARKQYRILQAELRLTAQRVNLFEQVKIPEAEEQAHRITISLADQQAAAVGWARIAKRKIAEAT